MSGWVAMSPEQEQAWHNGYFTPTAVRETDHGVEFPDVELVNEARFCAGCGTRFYMLSDKVAHLGHDRQCPRALLAKPGRRMGEEYLGTAVSGHLMVYRVHGLNRDGTPRVWGHGAYHAETCPCRTDPEWDS